MKTAVTTTYEQDDYNKVKESMTAKEVMEQLELIKRGYVGDYNFSGTEQDFENFKLHMALNIAIDIVAAIKCPDD